MVTRPLRHNTWKRARQRSPWDYTFEEAQSVVRCIVSNSNQLQILTFINIFL